MPKLVSSLFLQIIGVLEVSQLKLVRRHFVEGFGRGESKYIPKANCHGMVMTGAYNSKRKDKFAKTTG